MTEAATYIAMHTSNHCHPLVCLAHHWFKGRADRCERTDVSLTHGAAREEIQLPNATWRGTEYADQVMM